MNAPDMATALVRWSKAVAAAKRVDRNDEDRWLDAWATVGEHETELLRIADGLADAEVSR